MSRRSPSKRLTPTGPCWGTPERRMMIAAVRWALRQGITHEPAARRKRRSTADVRRSSPSAPAGRARDVSAPGGARGAAGGPARAGSRVRLRGAALETRRRLRPSRRPSPLFAWIGPSHPGAALRDPADRRADRAARSRSASSSSAGWARRLGAALIVIEATAAPRQPALDRRLRRHRGRRRARGLPVLRLPRRRGGRPGLRGRGRREAPAPDHRHGDRRERPPLGAPPGRRRSRRS